MCEAFTPPTATDFRVRFPQFANETAFPDAMIAGYITFAMKQCDPCEWDDLWREGVLYLAAHYLTMDAGASAQGISGGMDVSAGGISSISKSVGGVSASISRGGGAAAAAGTSGSGDLNLTTYGQIYSRMVGTIGARVWQIL